MPNKSHHDYLQAGWSVELVAAIDFTASNGDPTTEDSNHSTLKEQNDYEKALFEVVNQIDMERYGQLSESL